MSDSPLKVPLMSEMIAAGDSPDILFWVGCSGSFDDRAKKITKAIVRILNQCEI
jgi:Fe-S oxidoreductase